MFKPTYLYVKTHTVTGMKYFGKTCKEDPYTYKGSGTQWKEHLKEYGELFTTEIIGHYSDRTECLNDAVEFSYTHNIIESTNWANLKVECLDGGWDFVNSKQLNLEENWTEESFRRHREGSLNGASKGGSTCRDMGVGIFGLSDEQKGANSLKGRVAIKEKYGVDSIFSILNKDVDLNARKKEIFKAIGHQQGSKNSQYGLMWITNDVNNTRIPKDSSIPDGWRKGRVIPV